MGEPPSWVDECNEVSDENPVFDDPLAVSGLKDAFREKFGRDPSPAEIDDEVQRLRDYRWNEPGSKRPRITVADLNKNTQEYWEAQTDPPEEPHAPHPGQAEIIAELARDDAKQFPNDIRLAVQAAKLTRVAAMVAAAGDEIVKRVNRRLTLNLKMTPERAATEKATRDARNEKILKMSNAKTKPKTIAKDMGLDETTVRKIIANLKKRESP